MRRWAWVGAWLAALSLSLPMVAAANAGLATPAAEAPAFTAEERARILSHGPWAPARQRDASNRVDGQAAAVALGRALFFDRRLSGDGRVSCASCHVPARAFQDGRTVASGRAVGIRNTPSLLNVGAQRWFGWDGAHDSLWSASLAPLLAAGEMGGTLEGIAARVRMDDRLARRYRAVFGAPAGDEAVAVNLAKALAAYQATLVSPRTAFDGFRDALAGGDLQAAARYPADAQRGLRLFIGKGNCAVCHVGPAFSHGEFADIGVPFFAAGGVDKGRYSGLQQLLASRTNRLGAFSDAPADDAGATGTRHVLLQPRHFGEFKVPGLRGLVASAPYMHNGSLPTLQAVVQHYSALDEERLHADGERILRRLNLSDAETADLLAFLRSLSAPER